MHLQLFFSSTYFVYIVFWAGTRCIDVYSLEKTNMEIPPKKGNGLWMFVFAQPKMQRMMQPRRVRLSYSGAWRLYQAIVRTPSVNHLIESLNLFYAIGLSNPE